MTEEEWLACTDPRKMLEFLRGTASDRKLRLFTVACCRRIWHALLNDSCRKAVEEAERIAEEGASKKHVRRVQQALGRNLRGWGEDPGPFRIGLSILDSSPTRAALSVSQTVASWEWFAFCPPGGTLDANTPQCQLVRDIFGSAFRPVCLDPTWRSWNEGTTPKLAQGIYDDCAFDRLPILADALEEAGCTNQDILNHCRQPGEHVRGCWVVDLVLGKS